MNLSSERMRGDFFHLCANMIEPGAVIIPGNYGRVVRQLGWIHTCALREHALEEIRKKISPNLPSRLKCAFVFLTSAEAVSFRGFPRSGQPISFEAHRLYRVRLLEPDAPCYLTDHTYVGPQGAEGAWPALYWQPRIEHGGSIDQQQGASERFDLQYGQRELLTLSRLLIEECLD